jgi:hypothetical protein
MFKAFNCVFFPPHPHFEANVCFLLRLLISFMFPVKNYLLCRLNPVCQMSLRTCTMHGVLGSYLLMCLLLNAHAVYSASFSSCVVKKTLFTK